jgi:hypothetical protein
MAALPTSAVTRLPSPRPVTIRTASSAKKAITSSMFSPPVWVQRSSASL